MASDVVVLSRLGFFDFLRQELEFIRWPDDTLPTIVMADQLDSVELLEVVLLVESLDVQFDPNALGSVETVEDLYRLYVTTAAS